MPVAAQGADEAEDVDAVLGAQLAQALAQGDEAAGAAHSGAAVHHHRPVRPASTKDTKFGR